MLKTTKIETTFGLTKAIIPAPSGMFILVTDEKGIISPVHISGLAMDEAGDVQPFIINGDGICLLGEEISNFHSVVDYTPVPENLRRDILEMNLEKMKK